MLFSQRLKKEKTTMVPTAIQSIWLNVDSLRIHCLAAGESGSAVLLLHGGGLDSAALSWEEVIGPLSEKHRVFAPDLPGYGQSDKPAIQYTVDYYIAFLEQLMDALHLEQTSLVGLSMGGGIALGVTLRFPARVEKLVLVDSYGIQDKVAAHKLSYLFVRLPFLDEFSYWLIGKSRSMVRWSLLSGLIYSQHHLSDELVERVYQVAREPGAGKAFISMQRNDMLWNGLRTNFTSRLHEITVPTLIVHGAQDTAVPLAYAQRAHTLIAHSELFLMQECKHWPQREKPEEFNRAVSAFLN
jgi:pimeloyl-ACP methyl ester carboxylesterase